MVGADSWRRESLRMDVRELSVVIGGKRKQIVTKGWSGIG